MKTTVQPEVFNPTIAILAFAAAAVMFIGLTGKNVPLLSNIRLDIVIVVLLGVGICAQGGIGRVAATNTWSHPLSIVGYVLGGLILLITLAVFVGWKLPLIHNDQQALVVIAVLAGMKILDAVLHSFLTRL